VQLVREQQSSACEVLLEVGPEGEFVASDRRLHGLGQRSKEFVHVDRSRLSFDRDAVDVTKLEVRRTRFAHPRTHQNLDAVLFAEWLEPGSEIHVVPPTPCN